MRKAAVQVAYHTQLAGVLQSSACHEILPGLIDCPNPDTAYSKLDPADEGVSVHLSKPNLLRSICLEYPEELAGICLSMICCQIIAAKDELELIRAEHTVDFLSQLPPACGLWQSSEALRKKHPGQSTLPEHLCDYMSCLSKSIPTVAGVRARDSLSSKYQRKLWQYRMDADGESEWEFEDEERFR